MQRKHTRSILLIIGLIVVWIACGFAPGSLFTRGGMFFDILRGMVPPDWGYTGKLLRPLLDTILMSLGGSVVGTVLGLYCAIGCTEVLNPYPIFWRCLRFIVNVIRSIPTLILALLCTFFFGIGPVAGGFAITVFTTVVLAKIGYEDIESAPLGAYRALTAGGCSPFRGFWYGILPHILPGYLSNALYLLEANVRHSAILGYVGAGGVGLLLSEKITWREYDKVGMILLLLYGVVVCIEWGSETCQRKLDRTPPRLHWTLAVWTIAAFVGVLAFLPILHHQVVENMSLAAGSVFCNLLQPDWDFLLNATANGVPRMLLETLCIAILGTLIGAALSLPLSVLASFRLMPNQVAMVFRAFLMAVRTFPVFVYGLMFIRVTGPGATAGVLTLAVCSIGLLCKRFSVAIDRLDLRTAKAYEAMGVGRFARLRYCILPQISSQLKSAVWYRFDINVREAATLGLVGAGGIGAPLIFAMNRYQWHSVSSILFGLILLVFAIDNVSTRSRKQR